MNPNELYEFQRKLTQLILVTAKKKKVGPGETIRSLMLCAAEIAHVHSRIAPTIPLAVDYVKKAAKDLENFSASYFSES